MSIDTLTRNVQPGQFWQHFKGDVYEIICVTQLPPCDLNAGHMFSAVHTETGETIEVGGVPGREWAYSLNSLDGETFPPMVVYQKQSDNHPWARPLHNFLDTLCGGKPVEPGKDYSHRTLYYRFTQVEKP